MGGEKFASWTKITVEEFMAYMGFMILMGLIKLPSIFDYWKKDDTYHYSPIASRIMRDRFLEISRHLHFATYLLLQESELQQAGESSAHHSPASSFLSVCV